MSARETPYGDLGNWGCIILKTWHEVIRKMTFADAISDRLIDNA